MTEEQSQRRSWKAVRVVVAAIGALMIVVGVRSGIVSGMGRIEILMILVGIIVAVAGVLGARTGAAYRGTALIVLNSLVLFTVLELGASILLYVIAPPDAGGQTVRQDPAAAPDTPSPYYAQHPWGQQYLAEAFDLKGLYHPYVLFRRAPFDGEHVNVSATGVRVTPGSRCVPGAFRVFTFGGSTMWGLGVPDWGTIPAYLQSELQLRLGRDVCVVNYGELGFTSTQGLITLMRRLQCGDVPDLVIFYDGVNDINYAFMYGIPGIHRSVEEVSARLDDGAKAEGAAWIRSLGVVRLAQRMVGREEAPSPTRFPFRMTNGPPGLDEGIASAYLNNHRMVKSLATRYGFTQAFFWQPYISMGRKPLLPAERVYVDEPREARSEHEASIQAASRRLYESVYARIEAAASEDDDLYFLAGIFDTVPELRYVDSHHLTHEGNQMIAERMLQHLGDAISAARPRMPPVAQCPEAESREGEDVTSGASIKE